MSSDSTGTLPYDTGRPISKKPRSSTGIVETLIEVAAICLTTHVGKVFTTDDLIREAAEIGKRKISKREFETVAPRLSFLKKVRDGWLLS